MDFEFENGEKIEKNARENYVLFHMVCSLILVSFWEGLGFQMEVKMDQRLGN